MRPTWRKEPPYHRACQDQDPLSDGFSSLTSGPTEPEWGEGLYSRLWLGILIRVSSSSLPDPTCGIYFVHSQDA